MSVEASSAPPTPDNPAGASYAASEAA